MRRCLDMVFDQGTVFEIGKHWGRAAITALARLDGWPVCVIASDPSYLGGSWEAKTSEKVERFVRLADQFRRDRGDIETRHAGGHPRLGHGYTAVHVDGFEFLVCDYRCSGDEREGAGARNAQGSQVVAMDWH